MKKSIFTTALVVSSILITSCGKDVTPGAVHDDRYISVVIGGAQEAKTRGDIVTTDDISGTFKFYALEKIGTTFSHLTTFTTAGQTATIVEGTPNTASFGVHEWPQTNSVNFYAVHPEVWDSTNSSFFTMSGGTTPQLLTDTYTMPTTMGNQKDLLYASVEGASKNGGAVKINFLHALTRVTFQGQVTNNTGANLTNVQITEIKINKAHKQGTFSFTKGTTVGTTVTTDAEWSPSSTETFTATSLTHSISSDAPTTYVGSFFPIPMPVETDYNNVTFDVKIKWTKGVTTKETPFTGIVPSKTSVDKWEMGKWVNYVLTLDASKMLIGISEITVQPWGTATDVPVSLNR